MVLYYDKMKIYPYILLALLLIGCAEEQKPSASIEPVSDHSIDILDYRITPKDSVDKSGLMFSDQGAWFAYGLPDDSSKLGGFSGPFLMTQQNGIWSSASLSQLSLLSENSESLVDWQQDLKEQYGSSSHLSRSFSNKQVEIKQQLTFLSGHTALQQTTITNTAKEPIQLKPSYYGEPFNIGLRFSKEKKILRIDSDKSEAIGYIQSLNDVERLDIRDSISYTIRLKPLTIQAGETVELTLAQSFIFPEYFWPEENGVIKVVRFEDILRIRQKNKRDEFDQLSKFRRTAFNDEQYTKALVKAQLTLQNNWRIPAGEIDHEGLFPSYHYKWFNGFWSWDSWKHAVGLSHYNPQLAKEQVKLMFKFQNEDGFVADCVYRDTLIERHNYRDTKPPLSAWAVAKIYEKDKDINFVKTMYPKLKKYHYWWYTKRDHDQDGLCEYGSTDGSLVAAKWESGMDNAIRFDNAEMVQNGDGAFSMNQESVDLNAYLFAEKQYLALLAKAILESNDMDNYVNEAQVLKQKIQEQFYDPEDGWFYDTNLEGDEFIKGAGSEGWTALWAQAATQEQANSVKEKMMNPNTFFTKVPFQTMSADHEKFNPLKGYWRGPNWLDQAYFGVKGLRNYGFSAEADQAATQILNGAQGILQKGVSIRENYHPITGEGLNAQNFSWSAAHIIMMLTEE